MDGGSQEFPKSDELIMNMTDPIHKLPETEDETISVKAEKPMKMEKNEKVEELKSGEVIEEEEETQVVVKRKNNNNKRNKNSQNIEKNGITDSFEDFDN